MAVYAWSYARCVMMVFLSVISSFMFVRFIQRVVSTSKHNQPALIHMSCAAMEICLSRRL